MVNDKKVLYFILRFFIQILSKAYAKALWPASFPCHIILYRFLTTDIILLNVREMPERCDIGRHVEILTNLNINICMDYSVHERLTAKL